MKALTLWRPWPVAIFFLNPEIRKDVENRFRKLPNKYMGQRIAIHAGSKFDNEAFEQWLQIVKPTGLITLDLLARWNGLSQLKGIIGTVIFCGWHLAENSTSPWAAHSGYCWEIEDPRPLPKPIPCSGAQNFWNVPPEIEQQIEDQTMEEFEKGIIDFERV